MARHNSGLPASRLRARDGDERHRRRGVALVRARAADADRFAPYEATLAELYLTKAREEQGHARYADARALANEALRYAGAAARKATDNRAAPAAGSAAVPKR